MSTSTRCSELSRIGQDSEEASFPPACVYLNTNKCLRSYGVPSVVVSKDARATLSRMGIEDYVALFQRNPAAAAWPLADQRQTASCDGASLPLFQEFFIVELRTCRRHLTLSLRPTSSPSREPCSADQQNHRTRSAQP